jgi:hypothetical protein
MANVPIEFRTFDIVRNDTLHLSYVFDVITKAISSVDTLPLKQETSIKAMKLELEGKTANPNISVAIDGVTYLFSLNTAYITDTYPHVKGDITTIAFVIEGYSIENVTKERVLIFLPMKKTTETNNVFYPLEQAILNKTSMKGISFDDFIPNSEMSTDYFSYYNHTDNNGCFYHLVYFNKSPLQYTAALQVPKNEGTYTSNYQGTSYKAATLAKRHDNMTTQYEDNIYIDCVPVELENQTIVKYMKSSEALGEYYSEMMMYIVYIIILTLVVYAIYSINKYNSEVPVKLNP